MRSERAVHFLYRFLYFSPLLSLLLLLFQFLFLFSLSFFFSFPSLFPFLPHLILLLEAFFFFEGIACTARLRDVKNDTTVCNQLYLYWNKERFSFLSHEFTYSDVCNFLAHSLAELSVTSNKIINKRTVRHPKTDNTLFKITSRGLLIKTLKVLSIPSMMQNFSLLRLEFIIARSDNARYNVGALPVGS